MRQMMTVANDGCGDGEERDDGGAEDGADDDGGWRMVTMTVRRTNSAATDVDPASAPSGRLAQIVAAGPPRRRRARRVRVAQEGLRFQLSRRRDRRRDCARARLGRRARGGPRRAGRDVRERQPRRGNARSATAGAEPPPVPHASTVLVCIGRARETRSAYGQRVC